MAQFEELVRVKFDWNVWAEARAGLDEFDEEGPVIVEIFNVTISVAIDQCR